MTPHLALPNRPVAAALALVVALFSARPAAAQTYSWNNPAGGSWGTASNWTPNTVPDAVGVTAECSNSLNPNSTVLVNGTFTLGNFTSNASNLTLGAGGGAMVFNNGTNDATITTGGGLDRNLTIATNITVAGNGTLKFSAGFSSPITVSGAITNTSGAVNVAQNLVVLTGTNSYQATTQVSGGGSILRATATGLSANSNLLLNGGTFEFSGGGTLTRSLGTGPGQVRFGASGGLSAFNGALAVRLNNSTNTVSWTAANFVQSGTLYLSSFRADSVVDFQNDLDLSGSGSDRTIRVAKNLAAAGDFARISGAIVNTGVSTTRLRKDGDGTLELTGPNAVHILVEGGAVRAVDGVGLASGARLMLHAGGVFEGLGTTSFTRTLGTGLGQVDLQRGGFSAYNGVMTVTLNGGNTLVVGGAGGNGFGGDLVFGSRTASSRTDFQNGIDMNGQNLTVNTVKNPTSGGDFTRFSGVISGGPGGSTGLLKDGDGTLELMGANTYTAPTVIRGGALRATSGQGLSAGSNLTLAGGVLEGVGATTINHTLGAAAGQVQWDIAASGGFSAHGGVTTVRLNNGTGTLTLGVTPGFLGDGSAGVRLILGSATANNLVDFQNGIDANGGTLGVAVPKNPFSTTAVGRISGTISNGSLQLGTIITSQTAKYGILELTANNTYAGGTQVLAGTLMVNNLSGSGTGTGPVWVVGPYVGEPFSWPGGALGGTGAIAGEVVIGEGAALAPGSGGVGTLTVANDVTVHGGPDTRWQVQINGQGADDANRLRLTGASSVLNLAASPTGKLTFDIRKLDGAAFTSGEPVAYRIAELDTATNLQVNGGAFTFDPSAYTFQSDFEATSFRLIQSGNFLVLQFTPVPEPGCLLLVCVGAVGLGVAMRRRYPAAIRTAMTRAWRTHGLRVAALPRSDRRLLC